MSVATDWHAVSLNEMPTIKSPQRQLLTHSIANGSQISVGYVVMPPAHHAAPHVHHAYDMTIIVLEGNVITLIGHDLEEAIMHKPGDMLLIPAGVPHVGINPSTQSRVVLVECRADPMYNKDVEVLPHFETRVAEAAKHYREQFSEPDDQQTILELL